jgi:hypothetical protein
MAKDEPELCEDCPLMILLGDSWTRTQEPPSAAQICRRLRVEAMKYPELRCPHYANESLLFFVPFKAKEKWSRRAQAHGLNRFLDPQH